MQNKGAIESRRDFLKTAVVLPLAVNLGGFARNEANAIQQKLNLLQAQDEARKATE